MPVHHLSMASVVLIAVGLVYLIKPDIFQRPAWKKGPLAQRLMKSGYDKIYKRLLGIAAIGFGVALYLTGH